MYTFIICFISNKYKYKYKYAHKGKGKEEFDELGKVKFGTCEANKSATCESKVVCLSDT